MNLMINPNPLIPSVFKKKVPYKPNEYIPTLNFFGREVAFASRKGKKTHGEALEHARNIKLRWIGMYAGALHAAEAVAEKERTSAFWECECEENFIHPKSDTICGSCGVSMEGQPDATVEDVLAQGVTIPEEIPSETTA